MLLLDEPTTGLDPRSKRDVQAALHSLREKNHLRILPRTIPLTAKKVSVGNQSPGGWRDSCTDIRPSGSINDEHLAFDSDDLLPPALLSLNLVIMFHRAFSWLASPNHRLPKIAVAAIISASCIMIAFLLVSAIGMLFGPQGESFVLWAVGDEAARESLIVSQREACPGAPFVLPADGFIGLLYGSSGGPYSRANPHQGIDIFSSDRKTPGLVPVYAAYDGYITREDDWRSTLIQRVPDDPLQAGRQIWLYYTHMADGDGDDFIVEAFRPGARELFVKQGTLLGYTGNYNGNSPRGIWVHLHFSIVKDDGAGRYLNELDFENTLDPSPYLGMPVNDSCALPASGCGPVESCI